ncbi:transcriptional regulator [Lactococcus hircilactis]|uniref:Arginine repressor n=1 Tax=Lactococcus hircilactis TaxID=1494462 RepID=A0A7X1Z8S0_9LACT|nr:transcriptional regulator [Lactococcus hircilactis]MQW39929.1 transcriptional regulator [Lactococcus hircilactis]
MKREARLNYIAELISTKEVKTQDELVSLLLEHHIDVTQATISRDIKSLALIKIPATSGGYRYDLPKKTERVRADFLSQDLLFDSITAIKIQEQMLALQTNPGTTSLVKSHLLDRFKNDLFTVVIDDDTVLAIFVSTDSAKQAYQMLKN